MGLRFSPLLSLLLALPVRAAQDSLDQVAFSPDLTITSASQPDSHDAPAFVGRFPDRLFDDRAKALPEVWNFIKDLAGLPDSTPAPGIVFFPFSPQEQDPAWTSWQMKWARQNKRIYADWICTGNTDDRYMHVRTLCKRTKRIVQWLSSHPEVYDEYPFPSHYQSFYYDGTAIIQIDPTLTFLAHAQKGPDGLMHDYFGYGYYIAGHEMLHYALRQKGIPLAQHHCLFLTSGPDGLSPMEKLVQFLMDKGYADIHVRQYGLMSDILAFPCGS